MTEEEVENVGIALKSQAIDVRAILRARASGAPPACDAASLIPGERG